MKKYMTYRSRADRYRADRGHGMHVVLEGGSEKHVLSPEPSQEIVNHSDVFNWGMVVADPHNLLWQSYLMSPMTLILASASINVSSRIS